MCAFIGDIYIFERKYKSDKSAIATHGQRNDINKTTLTTSDSACCVMSAKQTFRKGYECKPCLLWIAKAKPAFAEGSKGRVAPRGDFKRGQKSPFACAERSFAERLLTTEDKLEFV